MCSVLVPSRGFMSDLAYRTRHTDRGFNKHRRPTKHVGYFPHRGRLLFYIKKEQLD